MHWEDSFSKKERNKTIIEMEKNLKYKNTKSTYRNKKNCMLLNDRNWIEPNKKQPTIQTCLGKLTHKYTYKTLFMFFVCIGVM